MSKLQDAHVDCFVICLEERDGSSCLGKKHACLVHDTVFVAPDPCPKGRGATLVQDEKEE